ncbi:site-2 protease family protein [Lentibacillus amyloliquefaciens]|uniref:Stage IV sporulation protein FB n=1 Tax=Lentibacillus amyloliquefaciens TaxID=1472767 RepID=A0A0U4G695_9BACI|nr:site-2 protease family protein [Lentibacillus amyloliquefaciens]ALX48202.1 stage IV sporulation protein FB [Lentibacillus amyloliquefaciens]
MTTVKWLPQIHIHPVLLIFIIISFLTGTFIDLLTILVIVLLHELGHFTAAKIFGWRVRGIMLWVFGGVMETDENGTRPFHEEVLVTLSGPLQHVLIYGLIFIISGTQALVPSVIEMAYFYNTVILLFNLLPIWPLDGGKLMFLIFSEVMPFRKSYGFTIILSFCINMIAVVALFSFVSFTLSAFLLFSFLLMDNRKDWKQRYYVFVRFLLHRYEGKTRLNRFRSIDIPFDTMLMDVFNLFHRDKNHTIYVTLANGRRYQLNEAECLHSYFHDRQYRKTAGDIVSHVS